MLATGKTTLDRRHEASQTLNPAPSNLKFGAKPEPIFGAPAVLQPTGEDNLHFADDRDDDLNTTAKLYIRGANYKSGDPRL